MLDGALARRFDEVVEYGLPDADGAVALLNRRLGKFKLAARSLGSIHSAVGGLSQAELVRAADAVVKDAILEGAAKVSPEALIGALENRQALRDKFRRQSG